MILVSTCVTKWKALYESHSLDIVPQVLAKNRSMNDLRANLYVFYAL